jgi:hypothetical protein
LRHLETNKKSRGGEIKREREKERKRERKRHTSWVVSDTAITSATGTTTTTA